VFLDLCKLLLIILVVIKQFQLLLPLCLPFSPLNIVSYSDFFHVGMSWSLSYSSWIYSYLCNQYLSFWVRTPLMERFTRYNIMR